MSLFEEEKQAQSTYSPGPIGSRELLIRICISPEHVSSDTNELLASAISRDDLRTRGFSVWRLEHTPIDKYQEIKAGYLARKEGSSFAGVACAICKDIREAQSSNPDENQKHLRLFKALDAADTAKESGHAHIFFATSDLKKSMERKIRSHLAELLNPLQTEESLGFNSES